MKRHEWSSLLPSKELGSIAVVGAGQHAAIFQSRPGRAVLPQPVHDDASEDGEVLRRVVDPHPALVLAEGHIQRPVHAVFYASVGAHCVGDTGRVGQQVGHVMLAKSRRNRIRYRSGRQQSNKAASPHRPKPP